MGSDNGDADEKLVHKVTLGAFWIDKTEVTNAIYANCVQDGKCSRPSDADHYNNSNYTNHPVVYVSWDDARAYCEWADRRLPTEAEWEKAARGEENVPAYPWGDEAPNNDLLNYNSVVGDTTEVGKYTDGASPYGALDMAGNVWEWVADWYSDTYYARSPTSNPLGPELSQYRVLRGGALLNNDYGVRSANRFSLNPTNSGTIFGFRCAVSATP
jgi:formylglycine-generating enzyme required for sulfatase activity